MSGEIEAAGAMATAGLVAGAIEGREPGKAPDGPCLNCGAPLQGRFCHNCGQAGHANRKFVHMVAELAHSLFHFDTKAWRTLPMLVVRPGTLTRNYIYGKRARYVSPLATFLLMIFLMFFVFSFVQAPTTQQFEESARADLVDDLAEARRDLASAQRELAEAQRNPDPAPTEGLNVRLAQQAVRLAEAAVTREEQALARLDEREARRRAREAAATATTTDGAASTTTATTVTTTGAAAATDTPVTTTTQLAPGVRMTEVELGDRDENTEDLTWQQQLARAAKRDDFVIINGFPALNERAKQTLQNPDLALYKIQEAASKFSFLLVPLSLPFIWLLFIWRRGLTLYDHAVYALYALSFAALVFIAILGAAQVKWLNWAIPVLLFLVLPVHTFFQIGGAYALGWWSALWRTFFMLIFAMFALSFFVTAVIVLGLTG